MLGWQLCTAIPNAFVTLRNYVSLWSGTELCSVLFHHLMKWLRGCLVFHLGISFHLELERQEKVSAVRVKAKYSWCRGPYWESLGNGDSWVEVISSNSNKLYAVPGMLDWRECELATLSLGYVTAKPLSHEWFLYFKKLWRRWKGAQERHLKGHMCDPWA